MNNQYESMEAFLSDINLTFDNCVRFNGEESPVTKMCRNVKEEFKKLCEALNVAFFLS